MGTAVIEGRLFVPGFAVLGFLTVPGTAVTL